MHSIIHFEFHLSQMLFMYAAIDCFTPIKLDLFLAALFSFTLYAVHLLFIFVPCNALNREVSKNDAVFSYLRFKKYIHSTEAKIWTHNSFHFGARYRCSSQEECNLTAMSHSRNYYSIDVISDWEFFCAAFARGTDDDSGRLLQYRQSNAICSEFGNLIEIHWKNQSIAYSHTGFARNIRFRVAGDSIENDRNQSVTHESHSSRPSQYFLLSLFSLHDAHLTRSRYSDKWYSATLNSFWNGLLIAWMTPKGVLIGVIGINRWWWLAH